MRVEKTFTIDAPQEEVWRYLSSPEWVGMCFPGCQDVTALGDNRYKATIKVKVGPIKTVFNVDFEETENRPLEYSAYTSRGEEGNRASRLKAESTLSLSPVSQHRTQVDYSSKLTIVGRFGKFGAGMMKKKADTLGEEFVQAIRAQIEGPAEAAEIAAAAEEARPGVARKWIVLAIAAAIVALVFYLLNR
jgi:carbon monoxide dehydrogenase subunit G